MKKLLAVTALALALAVPSRASTYSVTTDASSTTLKVNGRLHMQTLAGVEQLVVDSVKGLFTWTYGIQASTASFTGTGNTTYSVVTSSGIQVNGGAGVVASWFQATSNFFGNLVGNVTGNVTGNSTTATTATNIAGGAAGSLPYQTGSGATSLLASAANSVLSSVGTTPTWLSYLPTAVLISTQNVSPGFNGASNFLQVGSDGKLPTIDGSKLSGISGTLSGQLAGAVPVGASATTLSPNSFITSVSTGVAISTNVTLGASGATVTVSGSFSPVLITTSSWTVVGTTTQQATQTACVSGSTRTITTHGNSEIEAVLSDEWAISSYPYSSYASILVDGVPFTPNINWYAVSTTYNNAMPLNFDFLTATLSAGSHSVCLVIWESSAAPILTLESGGQFFIKEIR